jgi:sugar phosphate isomerase/epimerase
MSDYSVGDIYEGGVSSLNPSYGSVFSGYRASAGSFGLTTDPRSANILKEFSNKLSSGVKQMELTMVSPEVFDSVPEQQLKEVKRLSKLTGVDISLHGPVMDTAGFNREGFSELNREASERRIIQTLERSYQLSPDGNIPVTFHSAEGLPGSEYGKTKDGKELKRLIAVNRETGQMTKLEGEDRYEPGKDLSKPRFLDPKKRLEIANHSEWDNSLSQLFFNKERADEILQRNEIQIRHLMELLGQKRQEGVNLSMNDLTPTQQDAYRGYVSAHNYLEDIQTHLVTLFDRAYRIAKEDKNQEQLTELTNLSEKFRKEVEEFGKKEGVVGESKAMTNLINNLKRQELAPEVYVPIETFASEQSSKTFGNAAFTAYKKFKGNAPIINIENPPAGFALSTGEDLRNLVEKSREHFSRRLVEEEGFSEKEAKAQAEKLIGATWDVGHINMLRKQGFEKEDIIKETEKIAPLVKHVHLSDNFGFEHTELPMGMGNVPIKEMMEKLGKEGYNAKKIIEAASWWQHFQTPPVRETMEAFGSGVYADGVGPYWNQSPGLERGYFGGLAGAWLPQVNYETFGGGFSNLPPELGGQRPGAAGSRMSGRGME